MEEDVECLPEGGGLSLSVLIDDLDAPSGHRL
jgi:hypothetical protein